jgi:hypothetical protein
MWWSGREDVGEPAGRHALQCFAKQLRLVPISFGHGGAEKVREQVGAAVSVVGLALLALSLLSIRSEARHCRRQHLKACPAAAVRPTACVAPILADSASTASKSNALSESS